MSNTKVKVTKEKKPKSLNLMRVTESLKAVFIALIIGVALILVTGQADSLVEFFKGFWVYNFSSPLHFTEWLATISYLIPLGLALAVSFRMGIFNIGAAGQALAGGTAAFVVGANIDVGQFGWIATLMVGVLVGMLVAFIIAFLKNQFNINEVISSIMINWIIFYVVRYIVTSGSTTPHPIYINPNNDLRFDFIYSLFENSSKKLNAGIFITIPLALVLWWAYAKTNWGFKQEAIGNNGNSAKYLGISKESEIYKTMLISGALAGLAGTIYYCGYDLNLMHSSSTEIPAWTFNGITIALLGFNSPIGVIFASGLFAMFNSSIDNTIGNIGILDVVVAIMIILIAMSNYRITYGKRRLWFLRGGRE